MLPAVSTAILLCACTAAGESSLAAPPTHLEMALEAHRTSILGLEFQEAVLGGSDDVSFDKTRVKSTALLEVDETLVLSGVPLLGALCSNETEVDDTQSTVILITPRDPGKIDEQRNAEIDRFIERRRAYVLARNSDQEGMEQFKQDFPDWYRPRQRLSSYPGCFTTLSLIRVMRGLG